MSEQQESLSPLDSVSNASTTKKKNNRPGKAQRAAARAISEASAQTGANSIPASNQFARRMNFDPVPQPGKFPVVFPAGAGEPTKDCEFSLSGPSLRACLADLPSHYSDSARFMEFSKAADYNVETFAGEVSVSSLLAIAQHVVHSHQNMGLPVGDLSAIATTEVFNFSGVRAIIRQFGEFAVDSLGTRFVLASYADEVAALIRTAKRINDNEDGYFEHIFDEHWLPVSMKDKRPGFILASKLHKYFSGKGLNVSLSDFRNAVFVKPPNAYTALKTVLSDDEKDLFDPLFQPFADKKAFTAIFSNGGKKILKALNLRWKDPDAKHLLFDLVPKVEFGVLIESWLKKKPTITKFFTCGSSLTDRAEARGSPAQLGEAESLSGVTVVRNHVAISAPEFSLFACFPASMVYPGDLERNVVVTTSILPKARAIEFLQRDWL